MAVYIFKGDERPILLTTGEEGVTLERVLSDAEWQQFQADARLGRMVRRMCPGDILKVGNTERKWSYCNWALFRWFRAREPEGALILGGVSDATD